MLLGSDSGIIIGDNTSSTGTVYMAAFGESSISVGEDCMLGGGVQIGDHVWLCEGVVVLSGSEIGPG